MWDYFYNLKYAQIKARLGYKLTSASSYSYTSWSAVQTLKADQTYTVNISQTVTAGNYNVVAEIEVTRGNEYLYGADEPTSNITQMSSLTLTKGAATVLATGTLNYIAVGR